jgi:hypothetical protein
MPGRVAGDLGMRVDQVERIAGPRNGKRHSRRQTHLPRRKFYAQLRRRRFRNRGDRDDAHRRPGRGYCARCGERWHSGLRPPCTDEKVTKQESADESSGRPFEFSSFVVHWVAFLIRRALFGLNVTRQRPRASGVWYETERSSRGWLQVVVMPCHFLLFLSLIRSLTSRSVLSVANSNASCANALWPTPRVAYVRLDFCSTPSVVTKQI